MNREENDAEEAVQRLVRAIVGHDDGPASSLARRVLGSQIGAASHDSDRKHIDLSSIWRRIERKAPDRDCRTDIERIYEQLERHCDDPDLPPKLLTVLTKLMGNKVRPPAPFRQNAPLQAVQSNHTSYYNTSSAAPPPPVVDENQLREEKQELEREEALLLRECLYSLQGIDGERIRYYHNQDTTSISDVDTYEGIRVQSPALTHSLLHAGRAFPSRLGSGAMDALRISGEAGWLYSRIQSYIHEVQNDQSKGVVARAFAGTLAEELREYHSLLTQYESKLSDMTLRQLMVDLRQPTSRLKILAMLTDGLRNLAGGHLLSALHKHSLHGDTRHANLVQSLLYSASRPWFDILYLWTTQGVLSDPHDEFFVSEGHDVDDKHLWRDQYLINKDQIPIGVLDNELVGPAFNVGKGINFIRRCLLDGKWTMQVQPSDSDDDTTDDGTNMSLGYHYKPFSDGSGHNPALHKTLAKSAELVHTHILRALQEEHHMLQHLFALKQFLFLGQGDFFSALMDGLHTEFGAQSGVVGIYKHSLLSIVEGALRSTNAKYMPSYALDRLQVELLLDPEDESINMFGPGKSQNNDKRTVWDIFMLDYTVPDPLIAIVHPDALDKYKMVFSLLFKLKRVEFMLNYTWRQNAILQHALHTSAQYNGINLSTSAAYAHASFLLRNISITRQSMTHLIVNLKSYLMFEVLEGGWKHLELEIEAASTLDEVIVAHDRYLDGIVRRSLLHTANEDSRQAQLADQVQTLLATASRFSDLQENLFQEALYAADIATEKRVETERRTREGQWGFDSEQDITEEETFFGLADPDILREVMGMSDVFNQDALELLRVLGDKVNGNPDDFVPKEPPSDETCFDLPSGRRFADLIDDDLDPQRFLVAQLDHNNYYGAQAER
jgi:gamma-tubulin complex component 3